MLSRMYKFRKNLLSYSRTEVKDIHKVLPVFSPNFLTYLSEVRYKIYPRNNTEQSRVA